METAIFHHHWLAQMQTIILPAKIINHVHQRCKIVCSFIPSSVGGCRGPGSHRLASEAINRHYWNYLLIEHVLYHSFSSISPSFTYTLHCVALPLVTLKKKSRPLPQSGFVRRDLDTRLNTYPGPSHIAALWEGPEYEAKLHSLWIYKASR